MQPSIYTFEYLKGLCLTILVALNFKEQAVPGLSPDAFDALLKWLGPDSDASATTYREIHSRLTRLFLFKGTTCPEELADQVMDRVAKKLLTEGQNQPFCGDKIKRFYAFSKYVHLEYLAVMRTEASQQIIGNIADQTDLAAMEIRHRCLERCLLRMAPVDRELIIRYYAYPSGQKSLHREQMARELKIAVNALRIRASRARTVVGKCTKHCAQSESPLR